MSEATGEKPYTSDFYRKQAPESRRSAEAIVPLVVDLVRPRSIIDVGCGVGAWLSVFIEHGVEDVFGIDGEWVDRALLRIPERHFSSFDLEKPFRIDRQFDLAMSVEVAEHLPAECAETFVDSLVRLAPVVLFSAAIPFQGGTHHLNEQWPDYWAGYFHERGYVAVDCLRKKIWRNENVDWWYAQNILLFARREYLETHPVLKKETDRALVPPLSLVHPKKYLELIDWMESLTRMTQDIGAAIPAGALFILVDEGSFGNLLGAGHRPLSFPQINGECTGPPPDIASAIGEVERLRELGAEFIVFTRQAFCWLEYSS
ncbi:MAG: class I SAM-dependent methyltransferase, partial [Candidatus Binatia bacterium]